MRERLTAAFVVLSVVLLLGAGAVRTFVLRDLIREQVATQLDQQADLVAAIISGREAAGEPVDAELLGMLVGTADRLEYATHDGAEPIVVRGSEYEGDDDPAQDIAATSIAGDGEVTVSESPSVVRDILGRDIGSITALFLLIAVAAGMAGFLIASALSAPFQRLAVAAAALEDRVHRERAFAEHASHVLRTPLTGIRLELEDLSLREDIPEDAHDIVTRCLARVDEVSAVAAELVEITRRGHLVVGAEVPLSDLSAQLAQRWADRLAARGRAVTAAVEGDLTLTYTPGPVEHATDLLLTDVVRRTTGPVRIVFHAEPGGHLRITVICSDRVPESDLTAETVDRMSQVRVVVEALGGRVTGDHPADGVEVLLPRR